MEFPELSKILCSIRKRASAIVRYSSPFATLQRNSSICFSGKIAGRPDELPVRFRPVCFISCFNNWHVSLVIRKWFSNSLDKYAGIVTSKYPFTRVNSLRIKLATAARSITSSLLSGMVQLIVSQSSCPKAAKMFKKSAIFKHNKLSSSKPCVKEHVTSNSGKRSDVFHSTSENSDLNRRFLLNGKRPRLAFQNVFCQN